MNTIPRIAIFTSSGELQNTLNEILSRHEYSVRWVSDVQEITALIEEETQTFDAIIIPTQLKNNKSSTAQCLLCKSDEAITHIPIVVFTDSIDTTLLNSNYGAGADVVFLAQSGVQYFYYQVCALARLSKNFNERINASIYTSGLKHPVVKAFDGIREGFLILDAHGILVFANRKAHFMLDTRNTDPENLRIFDLLVQDIQPFLKEHKAKIALESSSSTSSAYEHSLNLKDGRIISCSLSISAIMQNNYEIIGYAVAITDLSEVTHLSAILSQAQRVRSLCLVMSTASQFLISERNGMRPLAPYHSVKEYLNELTQPAELNQVLNDIMEMVDLVVSPEISIQIEGELNNINLDITASDLYVILGHLILTAVEHVGIKGNIIIRAQKQSSNTILALTITAEARNLSAFYADDQISRLIYNDLSHVKSLEDLTSHNNIGLSIANNIAETYNTKIDYQASGITLRLRLLLGIEE